MGPAPNGAHTGARIATAGCVGPIHRIRPSYPALAGESLRETLRMLACGDVKHVVAGVVDAMLEPAAGKPAIMRAVVTIVAAPEHSSGIGTLEWPDGSSDPFAQFISMCR